jgi:peptidoglycan/xylan/chitin deacetylase (PgdA/CDA1 family)
MKDLPGGMPPADRDMLGHGRNPPDPRWPNGATLALSIVVNVEEGAELNHLSGDEANEAVFETRHEVRGAASLGMQSHFDYGARIGLWRVLDALGTLPATFSCCGRAIAHAPHLAAEPARAGHEVSAHGWRWESHEHMDETTERAVIAATVRAIQDATGAPPLGWHTRTAASPNTRRLLREHGGFLYDSDAYDDELPRLHAPGHVILPYGFDCNDMRFHPGMGFIQAEDFSRYCISAVDWLLARGRPAMLSIGLHLRVIARPARMPGLEAVLRHIAADPRIWVARRREIAAHILTNPDFAPK